MATTLYLLDSVADTHLGTDSFTPASTNPGWTSKALGTARGSGVIASDAMATATGTIAGITITKTDAVEWISPPVSADVTISGTITLNLWASENNMSANVAINAAIYVLRANTLTSRNSNTRDTIATTARVTEVAVTTRAANNFTVTPTSTVVNRGDRLRIILFGDDAGVMAATYTFNASWNGTTAAADGDTYVTFTEDLTFESAPTAATIVSMTTIAATQENIQGGTAGSAEASQQVAMSFTSPASAVMDQVEARLRKFSAPVDNLILEIQTDASGAPSGTVVGTIVTVSGGSLTTTPTVYSYACDIPLTSATVYWIVARRDGTRDATNYYGWYGVSDVVSPETQRRSNNVWGVANIDLYFSVRLQTARVYLTDTASAVATASVDKEAWTNRGSTLTGANIPSTSAGWTAPVQFRSAGTVIDWFTRPLAAFTLSGMAVGALALYSSVASTNSARLEIARVDNDGTNATVWGSWCIAPTGTDNGFVTTSTVERTVNVSGDDLAISGGQRLRLRVYVEDASSAPVVSGRQASFNYGRPDSGLGDSYITFPQVLTEYVPPVPHIYIPVGYAQGRDY